MQQQQQQQVQQKQWEANVLAQRQQNMRLSEDPFRNPYDPVLAPALPDMVANIPPELSQFRDQCASGVRQAVAMITAMEHQLAWERSRRQQAEDDCKVLHGSTSASVSNMDDLWHEQWSLKSGSFY